MNERVQPELPIGADHPPDPSRRELLTLLGASAALAGAQACSRGPAQALVPYVRQPPEVTPSEATLYATTMQLAGRGIGMLVVSREGRPTKVEGNPSHPASAGALGPLEQASILSLYDPARAAAVTYAGAPSTWEAFVEATSARLPPGKQAHVLLEPTGSPHLVDLVERVRRRGDVVVHYDAPVADWAAWTGAKLVFGRVLEPRWDFARAEVVLALDADFLSAARWPMAYARDWASRRRLSNPGDPMSRLYVVEARLSVTGMNADDRLAVQGREVLGVAADVLTELLAKLGGTAPEQARRAAAGRRRGPHARWAAAVAHDLATRGGAGLVIAGNGQPPEVHALAHAMNDALGNVGRTLSYGPSPIHEAGEASHDPQTLLTALDSDQVGTLVLIGGNPVYTAYADCRLRDRLAKAQTTAYVGLYENETSRECAWFVPEAHFLEAWSDARAFEGTVSIAQPLVQPAYDGKSPAQVLAVFAGLPEATSRDLVEGYWRARAPGGDFQGFWERALVGGLVESSAAPPLRPPVDWGPIASILAASPAHAALEIAYYADAKVYDGRFANNAWLQELPEPVTKLTWDNAALLSPSTARRLGVANEDLVELQVGDRKQRIAALVVPGTAEDVVAVALGYGQTTAERVSSGVGANAYVLRHSAAPWFDDVELRKTGDSRPLAVTQGHATMADRPIVLRRSIDDYRRDPSFARPQREVAPSLYELRPSAPHQWGMTIDLNACTGCSACVVACMAENNVPVVGKAEVRLGREMHWLRIDRYFQAEDGQLSAVVQPMLCQHCEKAPCEYVCPVNATVHSSDGLNEMVYNRCVGTRFCSNNCPYKVRRFNFFNYSADKPTSLRRAMNPDVTVRARGVMEKCTYCVQRIRRTEIRARREQRPIRDLEILTACQQTCPTGAIVFGDIADPDTRVSHSRGNDRLYNVLHHLGTLPRTQYLARIVNPNPALEGS